MKTKPSILCVDDEVNILEGLQDNLRRKFKVHTASSGAEGLAVLKSEGPFPVVISDMRMPEMNGAEFLSQVRNLYPDSMRILLTGQSDIESAISAVNEGQIFRFLTKPCETDNLASVIQLAVEQNQLGRLEKDLLENTLQGCVEALVEVLQLTNPAAFSRTNRIRDYVNHMVSDLGLPGRWQFEIAALLSQIGFVTLPSETIKKLFAGQSLNDDELALVEEHPVVAYRLISRIPRLESIASMILKQRDSDRSNTQASDAIDEVALAEKCVTEESDLVVNESTNSKAEDAEETIRIGALMLRLASEYDANIGREFSHEQTIELLGQSNGPEVVRFIDSLSKITVHTVSKAAVFKMVNVKDLCRGMVLDQEVTDSNGLLLMASGQLVTDTVIHRLSVFARRGSLEEPIRVRAVAEIHV